MKSKSLLLLVATLLVFAFTYPALAQQALKSGTVYGKVVDDKGAPLPGVGITLESSVLGRPQTATSGPTGGFRFTNLPPGNYAAVFTIQGFTEVRQEAIEVNAGGSVELSIKLRPAQAEEVVVVGETPTVDTRKTGNESTYSREYLDKVPTGRDPWVIIEQTPGVQNDRVNVAGSESGQQASFFSRGSTSNTNGWNYDGVDATDPFALGASPTYYDFDAFSEIQIRSGGESAEVGSSGVVVNLVTKRGGNKWEGNGSFYFVNDSLEATNTPDELKALGQNGSNSIDQVYDVGFDVGGPIIKDKLFVWGAYRKNDIKLITKTLLSDHTQLKDYNFKANVNENQANESQFGYFNGEKIKNGRGFDPPHQAEETLWDQGGPTAIKPGIWTGQHTFIPNDHTILTARYGYIGLGFTLIPKGGKDIPMIYLSGAQHWEDTSFYVAPIDRPAHDFSADFNWFKENWWGGDHEFKFGFEYKTAKSHTFSSYGNGLFFYDYYQTVQGGPLTTGLVFAQHFIDGRIKWNRDSFYATDTIHKNRLTLNLGFRVDSASGENLASSIPGLPEGYGQFVGPLDFPGNDFSKKFTDISPRVGGTYDITGDGKTIVRGNFARYYNGYNFTIDQYRNPTYVYNGAIFVYSNSNNDRFIDPSELVVGPIYYGGLNGPNFDLNSFYNARKIDPKLSSEWINEYVAGFEREVMRDVSVSATYTYRKYGNFQLDTPFGITANDFIPGGTVVAHTTLGDFNVPYDVLNPALGYDGTHFLTNIHGYTNTYNGVDLGIRKRMRQNWMLNAFVTLQEQKAHYNGGNSFFVTTADGITGITFADPSAVGSFYNNQAYAFASGGSGKSGIYPYPKWSFRASGVYQLPADMSVGTFIRYIQGNPLPLFATVSDSNGLNQFYGTSTHNILVAPIDAFRLDNLFTMDFNVQKGFGVPGYGRLIVSADFFNVFNTNTALQRERRILKSTLNNLTENVSPFAVRLGVKYSF